MNDGVITVTVRLDDVELSYSAPQRLPAAQRDRLHARFLKLAEEMLGTEGLRDRLIEPQRGSWSVSHSPGS